MRLIDIFCLLFTLQLAAASIFPELRFDLPNPPRDFLETGEWTWYSEVELPVSMEVCFAIVIDHGAEKYWYPEVKVTEYVGGVVGVDPGADWVLQFDDFVLNLFSFGRPYFQVTVDVLEPFGAQNRTIGYYLSKSSRERSITFERYREEYR